MQEIRKSCFQAAVALAVAGGLFAGRAAHAAEAEEAACASFAWPLTRERAALTAPKLATTETGDALKAGEAAQVRLRPMADVAFPTPPERQPKIPVSFAAVVKVDAPSKPGLYQATLSEEAWIDVVQNGERLKAAAFSGKTGCPGMRKSVRFNLAPLPTTIQISGAAADRINLIIAPAD